jgi:hypothetical protein
VLGFASLYRNLGGVEEWLISGWRLGSHVRTADLVILLANVSEMLTDWVLYSRYRGFGLGYHMHHLLTCLGVCAIVSNETAPVGCAILYASVMETGGAFLNLASLFPSRLTHALRLGCYVLSRLVATALICQYTVWSMRGRIGMPPIALAPVWLLTGLNLSWCLDIVRRAARRRRACSAAAARQVESART